MQKFHKKGMQLLGKAVSIVVILLIFGLLSTLLAKTYQGVEEGLEGVSCRLLFEGQKLTEEITPANLRAFKRDCKTITKTIPQTARTVEQLNVEINNLVANAWWMTGEGTLNSMWGEEGLLSQTLGTKDGCAVIFLLDFERTGSFKQATRNITEEALNNALITGRYKTLVKDDKEALYTYISYIQEYGGAGNIQIEKGLTIYSGKTYAISIASPETNMFEEAWGFVIGSSEPTNTIIISSYDYVKGRCQVT